MNIPTDPSDAAFNRDAPSLSLVPPIAPEFAPNYDEADASHGKSNANRIFAGDVFLSESKFGNNGTGLHKAIELVARKFTEFELPAPCDNSILVGDRWLCRGDGAILASTSGMGKSSLSLQIAVCWALGLPFQGGLKPNGCLRSLIYQSEDSDGDIAEIKYSLIHGMKLTPEQQITVGERVLIVTDRIHRGEAFIAELRSKVDSHNADVVWINPMLAFIDGDINDAEPVGKFLREGLNSINHPPRFAYFAIHHTAKPPKDPTVRKWNEVMYDMAGSAELTNWARAMVSLRANDTEGEFTLVFAKRGRRAGFMKKVPGKINPGMMFEEHTNKVGIKHSTERITINGNNLHVIFWEHCALPDDKPPARTGRPRVGNFVDFVAIWPTTLETSKGFRELHRLAAQIRPTIGSSAFARIVDEAIEAHQLVLDTRVPAQPKYYVSDPALLAVPKVS
jgi:hypothetical protein